MDLSFTLIELALRQPDLPAITPPSHHRDLPVVTAGAVDDAAGRPDRLRALVAHETPLPLPNTRHAIGASLNDIMT